MNTTDMREEFEDAYTNYEQGEKEDAMTDVYGALQFSGDSWYNCYTAFSTNAEFEAIGEVLAGD